MKVKINNTLYDLEKLAKEVTKDETELLSIDDLLFRIDDKIEETNENDALLKLRASFGREGEELIIKFATDFLEKIQGETEWVRVGTTWNGDDEYFPRFSLRRKSKQKNFEDYEWL